MSFPLFEDLESRSFFSVSVAPTSQYFHSTPALHFAARASKPPTAKLSAKAVSSALSSYTFKVTYVGSTSINASTIATGNVVVSGPNGYSSTAVLVAISPNANSKTLQAIYSIAPPSGAFTSAANGTYSVTLKAGSVKDINNLTNSRALTLGRFTVHLKVLPAPTAAISAKSLKSAATAYTFTVAYKGKNKINAGTIATGNVIVSGPNGYSRTGTLVSISPSGDATNIVATYSVPSASGSAFSSADNGSYSVSLVARSVKDTTNTPVAAGTLGTFAVSIPASSPGTFPNLVGTYTGTTVVPGFSPTHAVQLTVTGEDAQGNISGSWLTDAGVTFSFTGVLAADGTFTYSFMTTNNYHATGPVTGSGTGSGGGTSILAFQFSSTSAGYTASGMMNVTRV